MAMVHDMAPWKNSCGIKDAVMTVSLGTATQVIISSFSPVHLLSGILLPIMAI